MRRAGANPVRKGWQPAARGACLLSWLPIAGVVVLVAVPGAAQDIETDATASFIQPLMITGAQPLEFGTLAIPPQGECLYEVDVAGRTNTPVGICQFIGGDRYPARFTVSCAANALVQFQMIHTSTAPQGAVFSAPAGVMDVDGAGAGPAFQSRPCDSDGITEISGAGRLTVRAGTPHGFTGAVGTIRLEIAYD